MARKTRTALAALVGLGLATTGCNLITGSDESPVEQNLPEAPAELNLVFGGYEATKEEPAFGDPTILEEFGEDMETDADDAVADDPGVIRLEQSRDTDVYVLRITWGQLEQDGSHETDWSGTASVVSGAIIVRRTIRFEPGDFIHRPRPDPRTVAWTSHTYDHLDGVCFAILDPEVMPTSQAVLNQFTFETGPYTRTFTMAELAQIDTLITVDDNGNAIHFTGFKRELGPCHAGFMHGRWYRNGLDWGQFRGGLITDEGELAGHVVGLWGHDEDGRNVLYGKWIDTDGNFEGLLKGTFGRIPTGRPGGATGWLHARLYDENGEPQGVLRGHWKEARRRGQGGYLRAMWAEACPEFENNARDL